MSYEPDYVDESGDDWIAMAYVYIGEDVWVHWDKAEDRQVVAPRWIYRIYKNDKAVGMIAMPSLGDKRNSAAAAKEGARIYGSGEL